MAAFAFAAPDILHFRFNTGLVYLVSVKLFEEQLWGYTPKMGYLGILPFTFK
jgi:hypothetical protein